MPCCERKSGQSRRVGMKRPSLAGQRHFLALAAEEDNAQIQLELLDSDGHIGGYTSDTLGCTGNTIFLGDSKEDIYRGEVQI